MCSKSTWCRSHQFFYFVHKRTQTLHRLLLELAFGDESFRDVFSSGVSRFSDTITFETTNKRQALNKIYHGVRASGPQKKKKKRKKKPSLRYKTTGPVRHPSDC